MPDPLPQVRWDGSTAYIEIGQVSTEAMARQLDYVLQNVRQVANGNYRTRSENRENLAPEPVAARVEPVPSHEEVRAAKIAAAAKAEESFLQMLTPEQRDYHEQQGYIEVVGSEGNRYRIVTSDSYVSNIYLLNSKRRPEAGFCCHPDPVTLDLDGATGRLPKFDAFIAQKLAIEADEVYFLRTTVLNYGRIPTIEGFEHIVAWPFGLNCICEECNADRETDVAW